MCGAGTDGGRVRAPQRAILVRRAQGQRLAADADVAHPGVPVHVVPPMAAMTKRGSGSVRCVMWCSVALERGAVLCSDTRVECSDAFCAVCEDGVVCGVSCVVCRACVVLVAKCGTRDGCGGKGVCELRGCCPLPPA